MNETKKGTFHHLCRWQDLLLPSSGTSSSNCFAIIRMLLPIDDDDRMPPEKKPQLSDTEIEIVIQWINEGAEWPDNVIIDYGTPQKAIVQPSPVANETTITIKDSQQKLIEQLKEEVTTSTAEQECFHGLHASPRNQ